MTQLNITEKQSFEICRECIDNDYLADLIHRVTTSAVGVTQVVKTCFQHITAVSQRINNALS